MNLPWITLGLALLAAQSGQTGERADGTALSAPQEARPGTPMRPADPGPGRGPLEETEWRAALSGPDLAERERHFAELVERALMDHRVERTLRDWSARSTDPELAWTARLVLREVGREREVVRAFVRRSGAGTDPSGAIEARINGRIALIQPPAGPPAGGGMGDPGAAGRPGVQSEQRTFRVQIGPNGARVEVQSSASRAPATPGAPSEGSTESTEVYEAPNMGMLLEQYPELARELSQVRFFSEQGPVSNDQLKRALRGRVDPLEEYWVHDDGSLRTDLLGVQMIELEADDLLQDEAVAAGLLVERILPGTIAHVIGLRRGDVLLELNKVALHSGDDVSRVLRERPDAAPLVVRLDREGETLTLTWRPSPGTERE